MGGCSAVPAFEAFKRLKTQKFSTDLRILRLKKAKKLSTEKPLFCAGLERI